MEEKRGEVGELKSRRNLPNLTPRQPPWCADCPCIPRKGHWLVPIRRTKAWILQQIKALGVLEGRAHAGHRCSTNPAKSELLPSGRPNST